MKTRASICARKQRFAAEADALAAARQSGCELRTYRCDRCRKYHLTSRTKGKRRPRDSDPASPIQLDRAAAGEESLSHEP
jgi:hypothetical protein